MVNVFLNQGINPLIETEDQGVERIVLKKSMC